MIAEEFYGIAGPALRTYRGADSVVVTAVEPSRHGPLVRWSAPLLAVERERRDDGPAQFVGPVPGPFMLNLLARTLACRWRDGAPRCHLEWRERLARRHRPVFGQGGFECGPGWRWLWEGAAELMRETGIPDGFRSTQLKEKFGSARWYYDANEDCEYTQSIVDSVEHLSAYFCEECGKPGRVRQGGLAPVSLPGARQRAEGRRRWLRSTATAPGAGGASAFPDASSVTAWRLP